MIQLVMIMIVMLSSFSIQLCNAQAVAEEGSGSPIVVQYATSGILKANLTDARISLGASVNVGTNMRAALEISAKATNGLGSFLATGKIQPGGKIAADIGWSFNADKVADVRNEVGKWGQKDVRGVVFKLKDKVDSSIMAVKGEIPGLGAIARANFISANAKQIDSLLRYITFSVEHVDVTEESNKRILEDDTRRLLNVVAPAREWSQQLINTMQAWDAGEKNDTNATARLAEASKALDPLKTKIEGTTDNPELAVIVAFPSYISDLVSAMEYERAPIDIIWANLHGSIGTEKWTVYDPSLAFGDQLVKHKVVVSSWEFSLNAIEPEVRLTAILGVGMSHENNGGDLTGVTITQKTTASGDQGEQITASEDVAAVKGDFREISYLTIRSGLLWRPLLGMPIGVMGYARKSWSTDDNPLNSEVNPLVIGFGGFVVNSPDAKPPLVSIAVEYHKGQIGDDTNNFGERWTVACMLSMPFGF
jgi:hypothetical protein